MEHDNDSLSHIPKTDHNLDQNSGARMDIDAQLKINARMLERHTKQLKETETCVLEMQKSLAENTASTKRIEASIVDLLGWFSAFQGAFKVLNGIGKLARPVGFILGMMAAVSGVWIAFKGYMK